MYKNYIAREEWFWDLKICRAMQRFIVLCPNLEESTIRGSTYILYIPSIYSCQASVL